MIIEAEITSRKQIAQGTWEITFSHNNDSFYFNAGQYVWVITPIGRRAFSVSSSSSDTNNIQIIFRDNPQSVFKKYLLEPDSKYIKLKGPAGFLKAPINGEKIIYIAGGVGVAPVLSILRRLNEEDHKADIGLIFVNHTIKNQFYLDELKSLSNVKFKPVIGQVTKELIEVEDKTKYCVIGTQKFVDGVNTLLLSLGINKDQIIFEENYPTGVVFDLNNTEESYFKTAVDQSINHIIMTDTNGVIKYANKAAEITTGYTFEEMVGNTPRLWGGLMDEKHYREFWKTLKIDKKPFKGEFKNQRKNGDEYYALAMVSPILSGSGELMGFLGIEQDITETKISEDNLKKLTDLMVGRELELIELKKRIKNQS